MKFEVRKILMILISFSIGFILNGLFGSNLVEGGWKRYGCGGTWIDPMTISPTNPKGIPGCAEGDIRRRNATAPGGACKQKCTRAECCTPPPMNNATIRLAVDAFKSESTEFNSPEAEETYRQISNWNTSGVTDMSNLFNDCLGFNEDISLWDVSGVTDMSGMFKDCLEFNKDISGWNVSKVTDMESMFAGCIAFNQPLNGWGEKVSKVTTMKFMFYYCNAFNQDIRSWNVSSVTNMSGMFYNCYKFNQDIRSWNFSNVTNMSAMLAGCIAFNQNMESWHLSKVTNIELIWKNTELSEAERYNDN
jgi:surface protein